MLAGTLYSIGAQQHKQASTEQGTVQSSTTVGVRRPTRPSHQRTNTLSKLYLVVPGVVQNGSRVGVTAEEDGHQVWDELLLQCIPCRLHTHTHTYATQCKLQHRKRYSHQPLCMVHVISSNSYLPLLITNLCVFQWKTYCIAVFLKNYI